MHLLKYKCYQSVKKLLTNNLKHDIILIIERIALLFLSTIPSTSRDSYSEKCNAFRYMAFQVGLRGHLEKSLFIRLNPLQLCPNHELGLSLRVFKQSF